MRGTRTPSGIIVTLLDLTPVCEAATVDINRMRDQAEDANARRIGGTTANYRWGVVPTERGVYALCDEGVGPSKPISEADPLEIDLWEQSGPDYIAIFPVARAVIRPEELLTYVDYEAPSEPLETFVRVFGSRLDANYEQWRRLLGSAGVTV